MQQHSIFLQEPDMSIQRQMKRKRLKLLPADERPRQVQPYRLDARSYSVLHPTKGWKRMSNKRAAAQHVLTSLWERLMKRIRPTKGRSLPFDPKINRWTLKPHKHEKEIARRLKQAS